MIVTLKYLSRVVSLYFFYITSKQDVSSFSFIRFSLFIAFIFIDLLQEHYWSNTSVKDRRSYIFFRR